MAGKKELKEYFREQEFKADENRGWWGKACL